MTYPVRPSPRLILGSASPRRKELLAVLGIVPDAILPPDIDETPAKGELPHHYCARIAREKIAAIPADGIGPEVIRAGLAVLDAVAARDAAED